jgi:hypothetical protein
MVMVRTEKGAGDFYINVNALVETLLPSDEFATSP